VFGAPLASQLFSAVPVRIVGIASYSAFLWHMPILLLVNTYPSLAGLSAEHRMVELLLRATPLVLGISLGSYLFVEKPFLIASRGRRMQPATVHIPVATAPALAAAEPAAAPSVPLTTPVPAALATLAPSDAESAGS
jgi:peptidoglycan/LPS O-acetylase OafA/YrhL